MRRSNEQISGYKKAGQDRVAVRVIRTDEEQMIVRSVCSVLGLGMASGKRSSDYATKYISQLDTLSASGAHP
ncbi:MAG: hypothetical protein ABSA71_04455 [Desulfomonilia bacterium]|jgi:hypothetical protein